MFSVGFTQHKSPVALFQTALSQVRSHLVSLGFKKLNVDQDRRDPRNYDNRDFLPQCHGPNLTPFSVFIGGVALGAFANLESRSPS